MSPVKSFSLWTRKLRLYLLSVLLISLVAGCGNSHHDSDQGSSSGSSSSLYTKVIFHFEGYDSQQAQGRVMPQGTTQVRFTGYEAAKSILYGPQKYPAAQNITLSDVKLTVSDFLVEYLDKQDQVLALSHKSVKLSANSENLVTFSEFSQLSATVKSFTVEPAQATAIKGYGQQFVANLLLNDGFSAPVTIYSSWSSSDESVSAINDEATPGYATALTKGSCQITALYAGYSATAQLSVSEAVTSSLEVAPNELSLGVGQEQQLTLNCLFSDGSKSDITKQATWVSSSKEVATISASGLLHAVATGKTVITATDSVSGGSAQATISVTAPTVLALSVTPKSCVLKVGKNQQYTATATYSDGSTGDISSLVTWNCQPASKASISESGYLTAEQTTDNGQPALITASYGPAAAITDTAVLIVSDMYKFTVNNVYYQDVYGTISAKVICLNSEGQEYQCPQTAVIAAGDPQNETISFDVYADMEVTDEIKSITFYSSLSQGGTQFPFEWWDSQTGYAFNYDLELDIANNQFASEATGTQSDPYLVANPRQLNEVRNHLDGFFKQIKDIDFENSCGLTATLNADKTLSFVTINDMARFCNGGDGWRHIGKKLSDLSGGFTGLYDGNSKTIKNLIISKNTFYELNSETGLFALFGYVDGGTLKNIVMDKSNFVRGFRDENSQIYYAAGICAYLANSGYLNNCSYAGTVLAANPTGQGNFAGGLVAFASDSFIINCSSSGTVMSKLEVNSDKVVAAGGILGAGYGSGRLLKCSNNAEVIAKSSNDNYVTSAGGIVGYTGAYFTSESVNSLAIEQCINTGSVGVEALQDDGNAAGISGCEGLIKDCLNAGPITSNCSYLARTGGICTIQTNSLAKNTILTNVYSFGQLTCTGLDLYVGGILAGPEASATLVNTFYLVSKGADQGYSGTDDVKGTSWSINETQITNNEAVPISESEGVLLVLALNNNHSGGEAPWAKNDKDEKYVPLGYSILNAFNK